MIYEAWPLWLQVVLAPFAFVALVGVLLLCGVVMARIADEVIDQIEAAVMACLRFMDRRGVKDSLTPPTSLRLATELHSDGFLCQCGFPTRRVVVVRLYDGVTRVCGECAKELAPEVAA